MLNLLSVVDSVMSQFWDLEWIRVMDMSHQNPLVQSFNESIVYKGSNGVSLNDCLDNINPGVSNVLLKFRRWRYVVSADVKN